MTDPTVSPVAASTPTAGGGVRPQPGDDDRRPAAADVVDAEDPDGVPHAVTMPPARTIPATTAARTLPDRATRPARRC
jgi:hypothetical protein